MCSIKIDGSSHTVITHIIWPFYILLLLFIFHVAVVLIVIGIVIIIVAGVLVLVKWDKKQYYY